MVTSLTKKMSRTISFRSILQRIISRNYKIVTADPTVFCWCELLFGMLTVLLVAACILITIFLIICLVFSTPFITAGIHYILFFNRNSPCLQYDFFKAIYKAESNVPMSCHFLGLFYIIFIPILLTLVVVIIRSVVKMYKTTRKELEDDSLKYSV